MQRLYTSFQRAALRRYRGYGLAVKQNSQRVGRRYSHQNNPPANGTRPAALPEDYAGACKRVARGKTNKGAYHDVP